MEYQGRFYHPDIQKEHLQRAFKNFKPCDINCSDYPSYVEQFLQEETQKGLINWSRESLQPFEKNFYNATSASKNMDPRDVAKFR